MADKKYYQVIFPGIPDGLGGYTKQDGKSKITTSVYMKVIQSVNELSEEEKNQLLIQLQSYRELSSELRILSNKIQTT